MGSVCPSKTARRDLKNMTSTPEREALHHLRTVLSAEQQQQQRWIAPDVWSAALNCAGGSRGKTPSTSSRVGRCVSLPGLEHPLTEIPERTRREARSSPLLRSPSECLRGEGCFSRSTDTDSR
uniref:Uncharacterized protein n=1 Tax=Oryzias latipes TaxID=8090 RepID=A0A3P9LTK2_ORYLA